MKDERMLNVTESKKQKCALYIRLSREDGDKTESLSVVNQRLLLKEYVNDMDENFETEYYIDDGYTGTNFNRPAFQKLLEDIEEQKILCVIVKDLSRLGRNMPKVTDYIQEYFPSKKVRFIAIDDHIDKNFYDENITEDMMIDIKNLFNGFYPRDISKKVRSTFRSKQNAGQFIGAFACYGYKKAENNHNQLIIDEPAAKVVRMIYDLFLEGYGQNTIAKKLNLQKIPCPSEYKRLCGLNYHNGKKLEHTTYWTYSSVRNILKQQIYTGDMVQNRYFRKVCSKKAILLPPNKWAIVPNMHEAIISLATFEQVQNLLIRHTRNSPLKNKKHKFVGLVFCGECKRAMTRIQRKGKDYLVCGTYHKYGKTCCTQHKISISNLEKIILEEINEMLESVSQIKEIIKAEIELYKKEILHSNEGADDMVDIQKIQQKKNRIYEDYLDGMITKEEYLEYRQKFEEKILMLQNITSKEKHLEEISIKNNDWIQGLYQKEKIEHLDRETLTEFIDNIQIYEKDFVKITYRFSKNCG